MRHSIRSRTGYRRMSEAAISDHNTRPEHSHRQSLTTGLPTANLDSLSRVSSFSRHNSNNHFSSDQYPSSSDRSSPGLNYRGDSPIQGEGRNYHADSRTLGGGRNHRGDSPTVGKGRYFSSQDGIQRRESAPGFGTFSSSDSKRGSSSSSSKGKSMTVAMYLIAVFFALYFLFWLFGFSNSTHHMHLNKQ